MPLLNSNAKHPMIMPDGTVIEQVVHLNQVLDHPRISVGEFSYYHNFEKLDDYVVALAPYLFPLSPDRLIIGKFVQIAHGVRFITASANHDMRGFSTYPFMNFMMTPETTSDDIEQMFESSKNRGDITVGNDVWIGMDATIMPGVRIGDGAIIGAKSVVSNDVEPYSVVAGNPAQCLKKRFDDATIVQLQQLGWWDWPVETIEANIDLITGSDINALLALGNRLSV